MIAASIDAKSEFESFLHRHILKTQAFDFPRESQGLVVFTV